MPTTIVALIIIIFAILPGIPAYKIYKAVNGSDWRASDWEKIISVLSFSLFGLILYIIITSFTSFPSPIYIIPSTFDSTDFGVGSLIPIAFSLLGHFIAAAFVSIILALMVNFFSKHTRTSFFPSAWDHFIQNDVPKHWVVVRLSNGDTYAGIVEFADTSVEITDRDIILCEPSEYVSEKKNYAALSYQQLFIPASIIFSVAVVSKEDDKRISKIGQLLFSKEDLDEPSE